MSDDAIRSAPKIAPAGSLGISGAQIQIAFDIDPAMFPNGAEFIIMQPGKIEPLGKMEVARGCIIAVIPPEVAVHMRPQIKKAIAAQAKKAAASGVQ